MKLMDKKKQELLIINKFLIQSNQFKEYSIKENEKPDFILSLNKHTIGVELTEFFNDNSKSGSKRKREESHLEKMKKKTRSYLDENYSHLSILVSITYKHTSDKLIDFDFNTVKKIIDDNIYFDDITCVIEVQTKNLEQIVMTKNKSGKPGLETYTITDYKRFNENILNNIIKNKTQLQNIWTNGFDQKILLIHTGFDFSNILNLPNTFNFNYKEYEENWDKIYLFSPTQEKSLNLFDLLN